MRLLVIHRSSWSITGLAIVLAAAATASPARGQRSETMPFRFGSYERSISELTFPTAVTIGADGTIYLADAGGHCIVVCARTGEPLRRIGGLGDEPGSLHAPQSVAMDGQSRLYVADTGNHRIAVFDSAGQLLNTWGRRGVGDGEFCYPAGIAVAGDRVYVVDSGNHRLQVFDHGGHHVLSVGGFGDGDGRFKGPTDVAIGGDASAPRIFVVDSDGNRVQAFAHDGAFERAWGDYGQFVGLLNDPNGIESFGGEVFVADTANHRMQVFSERGDMLRQWGVHDPLAHAGEGKIHYPFDLAIAPDGSFAVLCEPLERRCQIFRAAAPDEPEATRQGIGPGEQTHFGERIAIDGRLMLIAEPENHFVYVFDLLQEAAVIVSQFGSRGVAFGQFVRPTGLVAMDGERKAMIADASMARLQEFRLNDADDSLAFRPFMTRLVRAYDLSHERFGRPDPTLAWNMTPRALQRDREGNLHVVDDRNATVFVFDSEMRFLRRYGEHGSGAGQLRRPVDVAISPDGSRFYVADAGNIRVAIFDASGRAIGAIGSPGSDEGQFRQPFGVAVDRNGSVFVSDVHADCVQKFDAAGRFLKKWGRRGEGHGEFWRPMGMAIDSRDRLFIIDHGNHRAQMFTMEGDWLGTFGAGRVTLKSQLAD